MKVIFHNLFLDSYDFSPAAEPGRMECIVEELRGAYEFVQPTAAAEEDIRLVHNPNYIARIKEHSQVYEVALMSAGGAILASELAMQGSPAFALIRPPGHHANPDYGWGFCKFNNVAVAVEKLRREGAINTALIIDFDLHLGDGTEIIFRNSPGVTYRHIGAHHRELFIQDLQDLLDAGDEYDLLAISAGFDAHEEDWGGILKTEDYLTMGIMIAGYARDFCQGRFFFALEGGYHQHVLGQNVRALLDGAAINPLPLGTFSNAS